MATTNATQGLQGAAAIRKKAGWFLLIGVLFVLVGIFGIAEPWVAGLSVTMLVGLVLVIGAVAHFVAVFKGHGAKHLAMQLLVGLVYLMGGIYFLTHLLMGTAALTLLLTGVIVAEGVLEIAAYFRLRGTGGSAWQVINGVITMLLGGLIWFHWPSSSVWAIGTLVGVNLLVTGISRLMMGWAVRRAVQG